MTGTLNVGLLAFRTAVKAPTIAVLSTSTSRLDGTITYPPGFSIASAEVEQSSDGVTGWVQIASGSALTFAATSLSAQTTYYFRARVRDSQGNYSGYCAVVSQTTQANAFQIRFNPGIWIAIDGYSPSLSSVQTQITAAPSFVKGIQILMHWDAMEGAQGNYSAGFSYLDSILAMCAAKTSARNAYFGMSIYIDPDRGYPSYVQSGAFDGGNGTYVSVEGQRVPCFWRTAVINAMIARDVAYMNRYDPHPNFEMHCGPRGESDPTYAITGGPGYSDANWAASWASWLSAIAAVRVHAQFRCIANFMPGGWTRMETLIQQCIAAGAAFGGPDVYTRFVDPVTHPYPADATMVLHGWTKTGSGGTTWLLNGTNYAGQGKLCIIHDQQTPEMGGKENTANAPDQAALAAQAVANGDHYLVVFLHQTAWSSFPSNKQLYWDNATANTSGEGNGHYTPDAKTYFTNNAVALVTQRPSLYG